MGLLKTMLKAQLHTGFCVQVSRVRRSNGRHDRVEDQLSQVTNLNRKIHTGNAGAVILFKRGGRGGWQAVGGNGEEGSFSFRMCRGGEFAIQGI